MNNINFIKYNSDYEYYNKDKDINNEDKILEQVLEKIEEKYCNKNNKVFQKSKL